MCVRAYTKKGGGEKRVNKNLGYENGGKKHLKY